MAPKKNKHVSIISGVADLVRGNAMAAFADRATGKKVDSRLRTDRPVVAKTTTIEPNNG